MPSGETLSIVGGDIKIVGRGEGSTFNRDNEQIGRPNLDAPSGRINLMSVASAGEVILHAPEQDLNVDSFEHLGEIHISEEALLSVSGDEGGDGSGTVVIRGGNLMLDDSTIMAETKGQRDGAETGIDVDVAGDVAITRCSSF